MYIPTLEYTVQPVRVLLRTRRCCKCLPKDVWNHNVSCVELTRTPPLRAWFGSTEASRSYVQDRETGQLRSLVYSCFDSNNKNQKQNQNNVTRLTLPVLITAPFFGETIGNQLAICNYTSVSAKTLAIAWPLATPAVSPADAPLAAWRPGVGCLISTLERGKTSAKPTGRLRIMYICTYLYVRTVCSIRSTLYIHTYVHTLSGLESLTLHPFLSRFVGAVDTTSVGTEY